MNQLTVRGFGEELAAEMRRLADRERISLNQAALKLLRRGAGLSEDVERPGTVGASLDHLIGSWSMEEAEEFDAAVADFSIIDEDVWA